MHTCIFKLFQHANGRLNIFNRENLQNKEKHIDGGEGQGYMNKTLTKTNV